MNIMKTLVIDTETTGLPPRSKKEIVNPLNSLDEWEKCRIVEIAWILYEDGILIQKESYIVQPHFYIIPFLSTKIHGITQEKAKEDGIPFELILNKLKQDVLISDVVVAHNMEFDYNVILSEWFRYDKNTYDIWKNINKKCTMKDYLKNPYDKWPRLQDLYYKCFGKFPLESHRALADAMACGEIYFYNEKINILN